MDLKLCLGNQIILFLADSYIPWEDDLSTFSIPDNRETPTLVYTIHTADSLQIHGGLRLKQTPFYQVYTDGRREAWYYTFPDGTVYAACLEESENHFSLWYVRDFLSYLRGNTTLFYLSALEYRMIRRRDMILHAAAILDEKRALLFAAPSGTGKSTQAALWQHVRSSLLVNGDRTLLHRDGHSWLACGWPMAGSSGVSQNYRSPIRALILLDQAQKNTIHRLSSTEAWNQVRYEIVLRTWDHRDIALTGGILRDFCQNIPVYTFSCRKDESAVEALHNVLTQDGLYP